MILLHFYAGEGAFVLSPEAARLGRNVFLGARLSADGSRLEPAPEPSRYVLAGPDAHADEQFLRKCLLLGQLRPADQETADRFGVTFDGALHAADGGRPDRPRAE